MTASRLLATTALMTVFGCGATLPEDVEGYEERCTRMNATPLPPYDADPHRGFKLVYACNVDLARLQANTRPFPDGTLIVKQSTRAGEDFPWLVATARKQGDAWRWDEYTRNFSDEAFRRILVPQSKCTDCHRKAQSADWIFTHFTGTAGP